MIPISMLNQLASFGNLTRASVLKRLKHNSSLVLSEIDLYVNAIFTVDVSFIDKAFISRSLVYMLLVKWNFVYDDAVSLSNKIYKFGMPIISIVESNNCKGGSKKNMKKRKGDGNFKNDTCKIVKRNTSSLKFTAETKRVEVVINVDFQNSSLHNKSNYKLECQTYLDINKCIQTLIHQNGIRRINKLNGPRKSYYPENAENQPNNTLKGVKRLLRPPKKILYESWIHKTMSKSNEPKQRILFKNTKHKSFEINEGADSSEIKLFELISPGYSRHHDKLLTLTRHIFNDSNCNENYANVSKTQGIYININRKYKTFFRRKYSETQLLQFITNNIIDGHLSFGDIANPKYTSKKEASKCFIILLKLASNDVINIQCHKNAPIITLVTHNLSNH